MIGADTGTSNVVLYGGGSLLVVCIGFALSLMRQGRVQYRDAVEQADKSEARYTEALLSQERRVSDMTLQFRGELSDTTARCDEAIKHINAQWQEEARHRRRCDHRVDMLIVACREHGVPIPEEVRRDD